MRKNSIKNTRVNAEVQRELSNILRGGIKDPRVAPLTSVVAVEVAPDLKTCKALYQCSRRQESTGRYDQRSSECRGIYTQRTCTYSEYAQHTTDYIYRRPVH